MDGPPVIIGASPYALLFDPFGAFGLSSLTYGLVCSRSVELKRAWLSSRLLAAFHLPLSSFHYIMLTHDVVHTLFFNCNTATVQRRARLSRAPAVVDEVNTATVSAEPCSLELCRAPAVVDEVNAATAFRHLFVSFFPHVSGTRSMTHSLFHVFLVFCIKM